MSPTAALLHVLSVRWPPSAALMKTDVWNGAYYRRSLVPAAKGGAVTMQQTFYAHRYGEAFILSLSLLLIVRCARPFVSADRTVGSTVSCSFTPSSGCPPHQASPLSLYPFHSTSPPPKTLVFLGSQIRHHYSPTQHPHLRPKCRAHRSRLWASLQTPSHLS